MEISMCGQYWLSSSKSNAKHAFVTLSFHHTQLQCQR